MYLPGGTFARLSSFCFLKNTVRVGRQLLCLIKQLTISFHIRLKHSNNRMVLHIIEVAQTASTISTASAISLLWRKKFFCWLLFCSMVKCCWKVLFQKSQWDFSIFIQNFSLWSWNSASGLWFSKSPLWRFQLFYFFLGSTKHYSSFWRLGDCHFVVIKKDTICWWCLFYHSAHF